MKAKSVWKDDEPIELAEPERYSIDRETQIERAKHGLQAMAERMLDLANRLSPRGSYQMTKDEFQLYRLAHLPIIEELQAEMKMAFFAGDVTHVRSMLDQIAEIATMEL